MPLMFEQQPKESAKAFAAFTLYLNLGPERSLETVRGKTGKSSRHIQRWSSRWKWAERVKAQSNHLVTVEREATEVLVRGKATDWLARQVEQREEEWKVRNELLEAGREALRRWKDTPARCGSLEGIARILELASKLGRLASGLATDKTEITGEVTVALDVEWEKALKKVYGGAGVVDVETVPVKPALPERTE